MGQIAPGATVTFQMRLAIPSDAQAAASELTWVLADGRLRAHASTPLTIDP